MKKSHFLISMFILISLGTISVLVSQQKNHKVIQKHLKKTEVEIDSSLYREGDIIFQTSNSGQSKAIQLATHSVYSHCGMLLKQDKKLVVLEAVQPVKITPLVEWIERGDYQFFVVKRLKNAKSILTQEKLLALKQEGSKLLGKNYDLTFEWSDEKIYCSELVWKTYQRATGLEVGKLQQLKDFDLSHEYVKKIVKERYGNKIPFQETVISPQAIFESDLLETVGKK